MAQPVRPIRPPVTRAHADVRSLALVAAGGFVGVLVREVVIAAVPTGPWPWPILVSNLTGAFALGLLLEVLARRGTDEGRRRDARLFLGTGVLGGYTTYSALAMDSLLLVGSQAWWSGGAYAVGSIALGVAAAWLGVRAGAMLVRDGAGA